MRSPSFVVKSCRFRSIMLIRLFIMVITIVHVASAITTSAAAEPPPFDTGQGAQDAHEWEPRQNGGMPLIIQNSCGETIFPAILTQSGSGPGTGGFQLNAGSSRTLSVGRAWQGRVWGRTNCSFNGGGGNGPACVTGDCGSTLSCQGAVRLGGILVGRRRGVFMLTVCGHRAKVPSRWQSSHWIRVVASLFTTCRLWTVTTCLWPFKCSRWAIAVSTPCHPISPTPHASARPASWRRKGSIRIQAVRRFWAPTRQIRCPLRTVTPPIKCRRGARAIWRSIRSPGPPTASTPIPMAICSARPSIRVSRRAPNSTSRKIAAPAASAVRARASPVPTAKPPNPSALTPTVTVRRVLSLLDSTIPASH